MSAVLRILGLVGWQGALGAAVGAAIAGAAAVPAGRWIERQVCAERVGRLIAERDILKMEMDNARLDEALRARVRAERDPVVAVDGGMPDDGYRRD
ncbi:MAG: hypothetical protein AcusKO_26510 [Acuticoccus sp.]